MTSLLATASRPLRPQNIGRSGWAFNMAGIQTTTMASRKLTLYNPETDIAVELILSEEDARHAENDLQFATALMDSAIKERNERTATSVESLIDAENTNNELPNTEGQSQTAQQGDSVTSEESGLYRWSTEMVFFLLESYVESAEKLSSGKFPQKKIWDEIAGNMKCRIPLITGPQCAAKLRSLKKSYKSIKDHNNRSGNDRRTWLFYEKMDAIFGNNAWASPIAVASSSGVSSQRSQDTQSEVSTDSSTSRKENVVSLLKKRLRQKSEEEEARAKRHKDRLAMDAKILELLSKLVDKEQ